jgi:renalase
VNADATGPLRVAVVGAGVAGLSLAARLSAPAVAERFSVTLFDKSRGPGGRCATRSTPAGLFDHGAGNVQPCAAAFAAALAASPPRTSYEGMNAWARAFAAGDGPPWPDRSGLTTRWNATVAAIEPWHDPEGVPAPPWSLRLAADRAPVACAGPFDVVVVAVPAEQARTLLQPSAQLAARLGEVTSDPCWTVMAAWPAPLPRPERITVATGASDPLGVVRPAAGSDGTRWVLQATPDWSRVHLEAPAEAVADRLLAALAQRAGLRLARPSWQAVHRWRYAQVRRARLEPFGVDAGLGLAAIGDAWHGADASAGGIERAWSSADALATGWIAAGAWPPSVPLPVADASPTEVSATPVAVCPPTAPRRRRSVRRAADPN